MNIFLIYPRNGEGQQSTRLRVDASIAHTGFGDKCRSWFILRLWIRGSLLSEDIQVSTGGRDNLDPNALAIKIGRKTMRSGKEISTFITKGKYNMTFSDTIHHFKNRLRFAKLKIYVAGALLEINWFTGKKSANSLDFHAEHLAHIGTDWGGLLGSDDHSWVTQYDPNCKRNGDNHKLAEFMADKNLDPLLVRASLN